MDKSETQGGGNKLTQMDAVRQRYQDTPLWLKAPNGKASNLTETQWLEVRTPDFKNRFGDWEAVYQRGILDGDPVEDISTAIVPEGGFDVLREWATALFEEQGGGGNNPTLGWVTLNERSVRDSLGHGGANVFKRAAFSAVKSVIERGTIINNGFRDSQLSFDIAAPVRIDGADDIVIVRVFRDSNTQRMYLHSVSIKNRLLAGGVSSAQKRLQGSSQSKDNREILHGILSVNKKDLSVTVDENGEPIFPDARVGFAEEAPPRN